MKWRPDKKEWVKKRSVFLESHPPEAPYYKTRQIDYEAGADAMLETQRQKGLYGEYGEDFIVSSKVKADDLDWAEPFFETLVGKGRLVFIPEEIK